MSTNETVDMRALIKAALFTPYGKYGWGIPTILWSDPAHAKSATVEDVCEEWGMPCILLCPSDQGEAAFGVTPIPEARESGTFMTYPPPEWVLEIEKHDGRAVIFVDELTTADGQARKGQLGLLQRKRIGAEFLGKEVRVLAAANPIATSTDGMDISCSVANRACHIQFELPTVQQFIDYQQSRGALSGAPVTPQNAQAEERRVLAAWPHAFARACQVVGTFLSTVEHGDNFYKLPDPDHLSFRRAWPSPRSWEGVINALATSTVHGLNSRTSAALVEGLVGEAAARKLNAWASTAGLPNPLDVLSGAVEFDYDPMRPDITRILLGSCARLAADPNLAGREGAVKRLCKILFEVASEHGLPDFVIAPAKILMKSPDIVTSKGKKSAVGHLPEAQPLLREVHEVLNALEGRTK